MFNLFTLYTKNSIPLQLIFALLFVFGCGSNPPPDPPVSAELISLLKQDYIDNGYNAPPDDAFTNEENSIYYQFWDGGHLHGNGFALNTSDMEFSGIAILDWIVNLGIKADEVMDIYLGNNGTDIVPISSAYRNPSRNIMVGGSDNSYHIWGRAIDFDGYTDEENIAIYEAAEETDYVELILEPGWVHVAW